MSRKTLVMLAVLALIAGACSKKTTDTRGGAAAYTILVDGRQKDVVNTGHLAFFPKEVSVHAGDSITFDHPEETGEPHTVALGTLIQTFLDEADKLGEEGDTSKISVRKQVPNVFPQGPGDANQSAAQPCFLSTGAPPPTAACSSEQKQQTDFGGTETFFNSGFLAEDDSFALKLSKTIAAGTYRFMCLVHDNNMQGKLTVVPSSQTVDSPAAVKSKGQAALTADIGKLKAAVDAAKAPAGTVLAGVGDKDLRDGLATVFVPKEISIPAGGKVNWLVFEFHTLSFNAPESAQLALVKAPDGAVHIPPTVAGPTGNPGAGPPGEAKKVDLGAYNGKGFWGSGFVAGFPPDLQTVTLKFTTAGTYKYRCQIHPDMEGTVKVG